MTLNTLRKAIFMIYNGYESAASYNQESGHGHSSIILSQFATDVIALRTAK